MRRRNFDFPVFDQPKFVDEPEMEEVPSNYKELTILELMEKVTEMADESHLSDKFFKRVEPLTEILSERLGLTPVQCVLYSIFIENYDDNQIRLSDRQQHTGARMIRLARYQSDIDAIEKKRYIRRAGCHGFGMDRKGSAYYVPHDSLKALRENQAYTPKKLQNLSFRKFMEELNTMVRGRIELEEPYELFVEDMWDLVQNNMHLKISKQLSGLHEKLPSNDWTLLAVLCVCELFHDQSLSLSYLSKIFDEPDRGFVEAPIVCGNSNLQEMGLIEYGYCDGVVDRQSIDLSRKGVKLLLSEYKPRLNSDASNLRDHSKIVSKELFYENGVKEQVDRLNSLLSKKMFNDICKRMKEHGMRRGFSCLFYGAPGTGKTETVLQLAKATGRNIMQVDFSEIKDKFVGESEKNVKAIFDNYREAMRSEKMCPILLFNEADAIIGKRLAKVEHAVDNMYNSIQNIILQEMENCEGILIATTNLEGNMDSAFERRFLYKVRFEKPSPEVRKQIWQSIIPALSDEIALKLAKEYNFSGGQIENISRKQFVDSILYGESTDLYASLKEYCNNELIQNRNARPSIGFTC